MPSRPACAMALLAAAGCTWSTDGGRVAELAHYSRSFEVAAGARLVATHTRTDVAALARGTGAVWLGDQHYSERLHALQRDVLATLRRDGRPLMLLLEAIGVQDEPVVDEYLAGAIDEGRLRLRIRRRWPGSWLDDEALDAPHFRALLAFARQHGVPVRAVEPTPRLDLAQRDAFIATAVRHHAEANPDRLLVVVLGQAHLLGEGDVVARSGVPSLVVGGLPTPTLRALPPPEPRGGRLFRSDGGIWWFGELF